MEFPSTPFRSPITLHHNTAGSQYCDLSRDSLKSPLGLGGKSELHGSLLEARFFLSPWVL